MSLLHQEHLARLILRLSVGGMMLLHGISKLGSSGTELFIKGSLSTAGLPTDLYYGVFMGEIVAPALIILGLYSRIGGALVTINMFFVLYLVHMSELLKIGSHGGWAIELQAFYLMGGICIAFLGSGKYALKAD